MKAARGADGRGTEGSAAGAPLSGTQVSAALVAATANGRRHAAHLAAALPGAHLAHGRPADAVAAAWGRASGLVLCMATGAAVRLIAPHLVDKRSDPPVVTVDDAGRFAVALAGGHHGGNDLARRVADALGATAVITTASEAVGVPALDTLGAGLGLTVDPDHADLAAVGAALVAGGPVWRWRSQPWPTGPLPGAVVDVEGPAAPGILVTDLLVDPPRPSVVYRPASLVVGVGASRGAPAAEIDGLVAAALADAGLSPRSVARVATVDAKAREPGLVAAAAARGWPLVTHPAAALAVVAVPNPSPAVRAAVGTPSVAEAAALIGGGELVAAKRKSAHATVALVRLPVRGRLALVGVGPGDAALVPPLARQALAAAEEAFGLDQYLQRARGWLRPGCRVQPGVLGDEVGRAEAALAAARAGRSVALVSGGDPGVYAMASPALERAGDDVDVVVVPGVSAALAAAALLGSPLGHDHCAISLSDLLTGWQVIRRRIRAAAEADFVVCFYNPRSRARRWQLQEACALMARHRSPATPVGVVTDAYRPAQRVTLTTLGELDHDLVGMRTVVVVGSSRSRVVAGRMVTPRGYGAQR